MNYVAVGRGTPPEGWAQEERWLWLDGEGDSWGGAASPCLIRRSGEYRTAAQSYLMASEEANRLILAWATEAHDARGRTLNELTDYRGCSFWSAVEITLLYSLLADLLDRCRLWERILETEAPESIWVGEHADAAVIVHVARARGIRVLTERGWNVASEWHGAQGGVPFGPWSLPLPDGLRRWLRGQRQWLLGRRAGRHNRRWLRREAKEGDGPVVLFLTMVRRFVDAVLPVIRILQSDPGAQVVVMSRNFSTACTRLEEEGIPFVVWEGFGASSVRAQHRTVAARFRRVWEELGRDDHFHRQFAYHGISLWPFLESFLADSFLHVFPELVRVMETTRALLEAVKPDAAVLVEERSPFQRVFVAACRTVGVPTIRVQNYVFDGFLEGGPITTDWIAADGESSRQNLIRRGTAAEKIVVTGGPRFDFLARRDRDFNRDRIARGLGLDPAGPIVLLAGQYVGIFMREEDKRRALQALYAALMRIPEAQLIVKLHPEDRHGRMERALAAEAGLEGVLFLSSGDIWPLLYAGDLVIVFFSTVGYEAIVMDKPLIQIHLDGGEAEPYRFTDHGAALGVEKLETLEETIRAALFDPAVRGRLHEGRQAYRHTHVHGLDGQAAQRVAELVRRVAGRRTARELV